MESSPSSTYEEDVQAIQGMLVVLGARAFYPFHTEGSSKEDRARETRKVLEAVLKGQFEEISGIGDSVRNKEGTKND